MAVTTKNNQLDIIKFNIEVFKVKNLIDKKRFSKSMKEELNEYLFILDENNDFKLNNILIKHTFSKYDVLEVISDYLNEINEFETMNFIKMGLDEKLDETYLKMEFPDLNQSNFEENINNIEIPDYCFDEHAMDKIISEINIDAFNQHDVDDNLVDALNELIEIPIFKYISSGLEELEVSKLINRIKNDIQSNRISGGIDDIVDFYFEKYKILKNQLSLNYFLDQYIASPNFISISKDFEYEIILNVIDKVRNEIYEDRTMDRNKITLKIKDYFKKEVIKKEYFKELERCRHKIPNLSKNFNLTINEINEIFDQTAVEINNNEIEGNLHNHLKDKLVSKMELNQSESRIKLNNLIKSNKIKELFNKTDLEYASEQIGELIYDNKIRSHDITEELISKKVRENPNGIY